jgi:hypothetical protein
MSGNAWIFVTDRETWLDCAEYGSYGIKRAPALLSDARPDDPLVAYVMRETVFAGIGKLTSAYYYDAGSPYPHRVKLHIDLDFESAVDIRSLVEKLDFITNKLNWPVYLKRSAIKIPVSDFDTIKASIEKQKAIAQAATLAPVVTPPDINREILSRSDLTSKTLHDRIAEMIHTVGILTGYDSYQRYKTRVDSPYLIDVAWLKNKNPQIAIEVHYGGVLGDALERLRHARDCNFRKLILVIVEPGDKNHALARINLDEKLKHVTDLWSVASIYKIYESCVSFHSLYSRFEESAYREKPEDRLL